MNSLIENPSDCSKYKYLLFIVTKNYSREYGDYNFNHEVYGYKTKEEVSEHVTKIMNNSSIKYSVIENHTVIKPTIKTVVEFWNQLNLIFLLYFQ